MAYKPGIQDTRESPALEMLGELWERGASVAYHDPLVQTLAARRGERALLSVAEPQAGGLRPRDRRDGSPGFDYTWLERVRAGAGLHLPHGPDAQRALI